MLFRIGERTTLPTFSNLLVCQAGSGQCSVHSDAMSRLHRSRLLHRRLASERPRHAAKACEHCAARSSRTWQRTGCREQTSPVDYELIIVEEFDHIISDSTLCVVEKEEAARAISRHPSLTIDPRGSRRPSNTKGGTVDASWNPLSPRRCIRRGARGYEGLVADFTVKLGLPRSLYTTLNPKISRPFSTTPRP